MEERTAGYFPGLIVTVVAGRETGRNFVVVGLAEGFLLLADGRKRPVARAKRKNPRHVRMTAGGRRERQAHPDAPLTDEMVRSMLRASEEG